MAETNKNKGQGTQAQQGQQNQGGAGMGETNRPGQGTQAGGVTQMAKDAASSVSQAASSALGAAADQAQHASTAVASGMHSLAGTIREKAPSQGMLGSAASSVAEGLESGSRYLQKEGFQGMAEDMVEMVRRNPIPCMLVCVGLGFVLGQLLTSSSSRSH